MPHWCAASRSPSSKSKPPNCATTEPGPGRCSSPNTAFSPAYAHLHPQPAEVPPELAAEIERIEQRLGELEKIGGDDFTDEIAAEAAQLEELRGEIDETIEGLVVYSARDRARAGVIVTIGDDGQFCLHQGLVDRAAMRAAADAAATDSETGDEGDDGFDLSLSGDEDDDGPLLSPSWPSRPCARNTATASCWSTI
jgi:hypothetical protein